MALKVDLKPHERIIIGSCVVTNTDQRARLLIEGDKIPILREKDIMQQDEATEYAPGVGDIAGHSEVDATNAIGRAAGIIRRRGLLY